MHLKTSYAIPSGASGSHTKIDLVLFVYAKATIKRFALSKCMSKASESYSLRPVAIIPYNTKKPMARASPELTSFD